MIRKHWNCRFIAMNGVATRRNEEVIYPHCKLIGRRSVGKQTGKLWREPALATER